MKSLQEGRLMMIRYARARGGRIEHMVGDWKGKALCGFQPVKGFDGQFPTRDRNRGLCHLCSVAIDRS